MLKDYFFHIHYCNGRKRAEPGKFASRIARTLPHHELMFFLGGSGSFVIGKKKYPVKKGTLLYIWPGAPYSIEMDGSILSGCLTVHFSYAKVGFSDGRWSIRDEVQKLSRHPARELKDAYLVEAQFQKLVDCWNEKLPGYDFEARMMLEQLLLAISQNLDRQPQNFAASLKVEKIIQHMHSNIDGKITLPALSEIVRMTPGYLSRTFKEATGYTIVEYFNKLKIDKAKELMIEGNKKVKEVAKELGFSDEFYFSRVFKKAEGMNPSEFYSRIVHGNENHSWQ